MESGFKFYNENGELFDHEWIEREEQIIVEKIIKEDSVVLELGARYGTVSCRINKKLKNKKNQVSVEPDSTVWDALERNRAINNCEFYVLKGVISRIPLKFTKTNNPYAGITQKTNEESANRISIEELESLLNIKFDTLVADCEGFLGHFFDENPQMYSQLKLIFFEKDYPDICDYEKITNNLQNNGFKCILQGFHEVWKND